MFEPSCRPRVFGLAPGVDFPAAVVAGLRARLAAAPPEAMARVELYVNTRRMARRLHALLATGTASLMPRLRLVSELGEDIRFNAGFAPPVSPLRRRLELSQLVRGLLEADPGLAPRSAIFDLADSLAALIDEMHGEGVAPEALSAIDVGDLSEHWARSLRFLRIVARYFGPATRQAPDTEARQRQVIERLAERWREAPPRHPIIVAGSTGSRGATRLFLQAVARLPQGAVILPGFDFELPEAVWSGLDDAMTGEDHPQFRFRRLLDVLDIAPLEVAPWSPDSPAAPARNKLISLAMRPAPVTDQWLAEGPKLAALDEATAEITLLEAPSVRLEALTIALRLRQAARTGQRAALITPDRVLARQVAAALDRWRVEADDSAGRPLAFSAPGRFLRHIADLRGTRLDSEALLTLLKHPLTHSARAERGDHLRRSRELELRLRRKGPPFPTGADILDWAATRQHDAGALAWARWLGEWLAALAASPPGPQPLDQHVIAHLDLASRLAAGPSAQGTGGLWEHPAGEEALRVVEELRATANAGGPLTMRDYASVFASILARGVVRDPVRPHPDIMIWGTLEARVQGAELVILGGLNEGIWPQSPAPDPWLSRAMRHAAGLLLPERRIGLLAHDFEQAVAAPEVWLSRAVRDAEAETVPSRWLNRLTNLLAGLGTGGRSALAAMRARGAHWSALAGRLDAPEHPMPPAPRPSPRPPGDARPKRLSVTRIQTLVRDPYAIYARFVLGLAPLDPLRQTPDAPLRGTLLHKVLRRFVEATEERLPEDPRQLLLALTDRELEENAPWPAAQRMWRARIERVAEWFIAGERERRRRARPVALEIRGEAAMSGLDFTLTGTADRIDRRADGALIIYDYKTGVLPTPKLMKTFDRQLMLEAAMAELGAFRGLKAASVAHVEYIGLGGTGKIVSHPVAPGEPGAVWRELHEIVAAMHDPSRGFTSRRIMAQQATPGDFDQLARFGEWDASTSPTPEDVR